MTVLQGQNHMDPEGKALPASGEEVRPELLLQIYHGYVTFVAHHCRHMGTYSRKMPKNAECDRTVTGSP